MKLLSAKDIREADKETISRQNISSADLMERASRRCAEWISSHFARTTRLVLFCGPGNNGGDGVALARIMHTQGYTCDVILLNESGKTSDDLELNLKRLPSDITIFNNEWNEVLYTADVVIDAIFGTGLSKKISGVFADAVKEINDSDKYILSIDVPSGLPEYPARAENNDIIVNADHTLTFQAPKISFMFPSVFRYCGTFTVLDINLDKDFISTCSSEYHYITKEYARAIVKHRTKFDHKGNHGHGLLVAGNFGKAGAAILAADAAVHSGCGLLTIASPECNHHPLQTAVPEAMYIRSGDMNIDGLPRLDIFDAIAAGPGIGKEESVSQTIKSLIQNSPVPLVLDADALNILSDNKTWLAFLPAFSILTPHPGEFARLTGSKEEDDFKRLESAREFARKNKIILVLKGAHTAICSPDGKVYFNSTGNPGLAKGGTGDALTGIILSMLCEGYPPLNAAILGVYLHGLSAELATEGSSEEALIARNLISNLGKAFTSLKS